MNPNSATRWTLKGLLSVFAALLLVFAFAGIVWSQTETGQISGTVFDPSNAVVPKAKVTVRNVNTGAERTTATNDNGDYAVSHLLSGEYAVIVEAPGGGLAKMEQHVQITVGATIALDFHLTLGSAPVTTVEVKGGGGAVVNTETQTLGTVISSKDIQELPTLTRNPYDLALNVGTASVTDPSGRGVGAAFNGLRSAGTNILLDGSSNNDEFTATVGQVVPLDSVQEFSVLTNNFTAEYGRASSAVVNVVTKGGTNDFHGSAYEYNRISKLAANAYNNNATAVPRSVFVRNQFGYSIGGPIKKNKLFFFNNIEWIRVRSAANQNVLVVDPALVSLAAPATKDYFNTFAKLRSNAKILNTYTRSQLKALGGTKGDPCSGVPDNTDPCSSVPASTPMFDRLTYSTPSDAGAGNPQNTYEIVGRVDWNKSDRTSFYGRYALSKLNLSPGVISNSAYIGFDTGETQTNNNFLLSMVHTFNSRVTSQSKIVFNRLNLLDPLGANPAAPGLFFNPVGTTNLIGTPVMMPGYLSLTPGNGIPFGGPQNFVQTYQDFTYVKGTHNWRFGGSYVYIRDNRTFGAYETPVAAFSKTGNVKDASMNNLLNGVLGFFQAAIFPQGKFPCRFPITMGHPCTNPATMQVDPSGDVNLPVGQPQFSRSNRYHEFAVYGQDSWKVTSRLTVNLGMRWEYFGVQHNKDPRLDSNLYLGTGGSVFDQIRNSAVAITPNSPIGGLWAKDWNNFGPRIGFAWDLFGNGKTSLRAGYGVAYERNFGNVTFNVIQNPPNYAVISLLQGVDVATIPVTTNVAGPLAGTSGVKALPQVSLRAVNPNIRTAYAHTWNGSLEHQFGQNTIMGIDYSGSHGANLYDIANVNRPGSGNVYEGDSATFSRLRTTQYSNINFRSDLGISNYNALVGRVTMRNFANSGVTLDANYTWSHAFDELSDTFSSSFNQFNLGYLDPFNPKVDYGNAYFDVRQRFTGTAVWEIPLARHSSGVVKQIAGGWEVAPIFTAQSGSPFSIFDCTNALQVCPYAFNAAGTSGIRHINSSAPADSTHPNAFIWTPTTSSDGLTNLFDSTYANPIVGISDFGPFPKNMNPRNAFRGPGTWFFNLGIYKSFFLTERFKLQFRGELYNVFNHSNMYIQGGSAEVGSTNGICLNPLANPPCTQVFSYIPAARGLLASGANSVQDNRNVQLAIRLTF